MRDRAPLKYGRRGGYVNHRCVCRSGGSRYACQGHRQRVQIQAVGWGHQGVPLCLEHPQQRLQAGGSGPLQIHPPQERLVLCTCRAAMATALTPEIGYQRPLQTVHQLRCAIPDGYAKNDQALHSCERACHMVAFVMQQGHTDFVVVARPFEREVEAVAEVGWGCGMMCVAKAFQNLSCPGCMHAGRMHVIQAHAYHLQRLM